MREKIGASVHEKTPFSLEFVQNCSNHSKLCIPYARWEESFCRLVQESGSYQYNKETVSDTVNVGG